MIEWLPNRSSSFMMRTGLCVEFWSGHSGEAERQGVGSVKSACFDVEAVIEIEGVKVGPKRSHIALRYLRVEKSKSRMASSAADSSCIGNTGSSDLGLALVFEKPGQFTLPILDISRIRCKYLQQGKASVEAKGCLVLLTTSSQTDLERLLHFIRDVKTGRTIADFRSCSLCTDTGHGHRNQAKHKREPQHLTDSVQASKLDGDCQASKKQKVKVLECIFRKKNLFNLLNTGQDQAHNQSKDLRNRDRDQASPKLKSLGTSPPEGTEAQPIDLEDEFYDASEEIEAKPVEQTKDSNGLRTRSLRYYHKGRDAHEVTPTSSPCGKVLIMDERKRRNLADGIRRREKQRSLSERRERVDLRLGDEKENFEMWVEDNKSKIGDATVKRLVEERRSLEDEQRKVHEEQRRVLEEQKRLKEERIMFQEEERRRAEENDRMLRRAEELRKLVELERKRVAEWEAKKEEERKWREAEERKQREEDEKLRKLREKRQREEERRRLEEKKQKEEFERKRKEEERKKKEEEERKRKEEEERIRKEEEQKKQKEEERRRREEEERRKALLERRLQEQERRRKEEENKRMQELQQREKEEKRLRKEQLLEEQRKHEEEEKRQEALRKLKLEEIQRKVWQTKQEELRKFQDIRNGIRIQDQERRRKLEEATRVAVDAFKTRIVGDERRKQEEARRKTMEEHKERTLDEDMKRWQNEENRRRAKEDRSKISEHERLKSAEQRKRVEEVMRMSRDMARKRMEENLKDQQERKQAAEETIDENRYADVFSEGKRILDDDIRKLVDKANNLASLEELFMKMKERCSRGRNEKENSEGLFADQSKGMAYLFTKLEERKQTVRDEQEKVRKDREGLNAKTGTPAGIPTHTQAKSEESSRLASISSSTVNVVHFVQKLRREELKKLELERKRVEKAAIGLKKKLFQDQARAAKLEARRLEKERKEAEKQAKAEERAKQQQKAHEQARQRASASANANPSPCVPRTHHLSYQQYEDLWNLMKMARNDSTLRFRDIPWPPHGNPLFVEVGDSLAAQKRKLRIALLRWHPDKFVSLCGRRLSILERVSIEAHAKNVAQEVIQWKSKLESIQ